MKKEDTNFKKIIFLIIAACLAAVLISLWRQTQLRQRLHEKKSSNVNSTTNLNSVNLKDTIIPITTSRGEPAHIDTGNLEKNILIEYWATWCIPSRRDLVALSNLSGESSKNWDIYLVNMGEEKAVAKNYLMANGISFSSINYDEVAKIVSVDYPHAQVIVKKDSSMQIKQFDSISDEVLKYN